MVLALIIKDSKLIKIIPITVNTRAFICAFIRGTPLRQIDIIHNTITLLKEY